MNYNVGVRKPCLRGTSMACALRKYKSFSFYVKRKKRQMRYTILVIAVICFALIANTELYAQEHENITQIGRLWNFWEAVYDVKIVDDFAYVAAGVSGLQVVDIAGQGHPYVTGYFDDNPSYVYSLAISGDYAYLADRIGGLIVVDISDPENPLECGSCQLGVVSGVAVRGNHAYVIATDLGSHDETQPHIRIVDISDPDNPREVGIYETAGRTNEIMFSG